MNKAFWKKHITRGVCIFVIIKVFGGLQNVIFKKPVFVNNRTDYSLDPIYNDETGSFTVIDKDNVMFTMKPREGCTSNHKYVVMALSAPQNAKKREILR